jgi:hypothetical protein
VTLGGSDFSVASVATATMDAMRKQAVSNAATLVKEKGGADTIASVLCSVSDNRVLTSTLDQILEVKDGDQV